MLRHRHLSSHADHVQIVGVSTSDPLGCACHPGTVIVIVTVVNEVHGALVLILTEVENILRLEGGGESEGERGRGGERGIRKKQIG